MKKLFLTVIAVLFTIPSFAQSESSEYNLPYVKPTLDKVSPDKVKPDVTLTRTITLEDGTKCEEYKYEEDFDEFFLYTYKKKNGDFYTIGTFKGTAKDNNSLNKYLTLQIPENHFYPKEINIALDSRITIGEKVVMTTVRDNTLNCIYEFPNGLIYKYVKDVGEIIYLPNEYDKGIKRIGVPGPKELRDDEEIYEGTLYGYPVNDRLYQIIEGELKPIAQKFGERFYFANQSDTIINVTESQKGSFNTVEIKYKNGDSFSTMLNGHFDYGTIHRNGGIITFKKDVKPTLTLPDGTKYVLEDVRANPNYKPFDYGQECYMNGRRVCNYDYEKELSFQCLLQADELIIRTADVTYPDGSTDKIVDYKSKKQTEKENEAVTKEQYNELCRMYGKKYVDAALEGSITQKAPIIGMPERLFVGAYKAERFSQTGNTTSYRVYGWGVTNNRKAMTLGDKILKYTVTVKNGKVASVFTHR